MKRLIKGIWFLSNAVLGLVFCVLYLRFTYRMFFPPYDEINIIFILLFLIFAEGFVESFISCLGADVDSWQCWVSHLLLTVAIALVFCTSYQLFADLKQYFADGNPVAIAIGLFVMLVEGMLSPMLISKYSSWVLLGITLTSKYDSKAEFIFPAVLIIINIVTQIVLNNVDLTSVGIFAYIGVFGVLSIASFIVTINKID